MPVHLLGEWLLAFLNMFLAGSELFPRFPNTGMSVRLQYRVGLYSVHPRSSTGMVGVG